MSDMKCPFCQQELERVYSRPFQLICANCGSLGTDKLWQELIRTRKALGYAQSALVKLANDAYDMDEHIYIDKILNQIKTALEQKDK